MTKVWQPGETALLRNVARGRVWTVVGTTVVFDRPDLLALYWTVGYPRKSPAGERDGIRAAWLSGADFTHVDNLWLDLEILCLTEPTAGHAAWMARRQGEFLGWYINMQTPLVRSEVGFDTMDQALDLIIRPDLITHRWKDEYELTEDVAHGFTTSEQAAAIRAEGERVLEMAGNREAPFCDGWETWRPDPAWSVPEIPEGWDRL